VNKNISYRNPPKQVPKKGLTMGTFGVLAVGLGGGARGMVVVVVVVVVVDVMVLFETKGGRGGACVQDLQEG